MNTIPLSLYDRIFSEKLKHRFEQIIIWLALGGFAVHLMVYFLVHWGWIQLPVEWDMLNSPIAAIYTPFSFILIYEVFLLVYYLPRSFTTAIGKQFEIISLIIIRRIFKDIAKLEAHNFVQEDQIALWADMVGCLLIFGLVFLFNELKRRKPTLQPGRDIQRFIRTKKVIALLLLPALLALVVYSFGDWVYELWAYSREALQEITDINQVFYNEFFTLLVLVDVFILILSLRYTDNYSQIIRNSGFIISTVLIRISFHTPQVFNTLLVVIGVAFGVIILWIYNGMATLEAKGVNDLPEDPEEEEGV